MVILALLGGDFFGVTDAKGVTVWALVVVMDASLSGVDVSEASSAAVARMELVNCLKAADSVQQVESAIGTVVDRGVSSGELFHLWVIPGVDFVK
jgi:hypothetical protein